MRRVEPIQPQPGSSQRVELRRFEFRMPVVAGIAPTLIIGHYKHDICPIVRSRCARAECSNGCEAQKQRYESIHVETPAKPLWADELVLRLRVDGFYQWSLEDARRCWHERLDIDERGRCENGTVAPRWRGSLRFLSP